MTAPGSPPPLSLPPPAPRSQALRKLSSLEQLEVRPLYLRFTPEVACPLALAAPWLPPRLVQLTLKKTKVRAPPTPPHPAPSLTTLQRACMHAIAICIR